MEKLNIFIAFSILESVYSMHQILSSSDKVWHVTKNYYKMWQYYKVWQGIITYKLWQVIQYDSYYKVRRNRTWPDVFYIYHAYRTSVIKNLKAWEHRHWLNLSETGNQFIFSYYFIPMLVVLSTTLSIA